MKKILTLALLVGIALFASSCQKEVTQVIQPNQTIVFTVNQSNWVYDEDSNSWFADVDMPEIDNYVQDNGGVLVYMDRNGYYEQLPMLYDSITFSYTTSPGNLQLAAQYYDGAQDSAPKPPRPQTARYKIIIIDSVR